MVGVTENTSCVLIRQGVYDLDSGSCFWCSGLPDLRSLNF